MHVMALPVWVLLGVVCLNWYPVQQPAAPETKKPNRSQFEQRAILYQPVLHWADGTKTHQGTGFFSKTSTNQIVAITCAHLIDVNGPELVKAEWLDLATDKSVATMTRCWGNPGSEGTDEPLDIRFDYLIMPATEPVDPGLLLELDSRAKPNFGERVWFPNKGAATKTGFEIIEGTVLEVEAGYVLVLLDKKVKTASRSGTPIISQDTGKVVGLFAKSGEADGKTAVGLTPIPEILKGLDKDQATPFLKEVTGKKRPPAPKPDLAAGWEKFSVGSTRLTLSMPGAPRELPDEPSLSRPILVQKHFVYTKNEMLIAISYLELNQVANAKEYAQGFLYGLKRNNSPNLKVNSKIQSLIPGQATFIANIIDGTNQLEMNGGIWAKGNSLWFVMGRYPQNDEMARKITQRILDSVQIKTKPK